jgi:hypothetical protein
MARLVPFMENGKRKFADYDTQRVKNLQEGDIIERGMREEKVLHIREEENVIISYVTYTSERHPHFAEGVIIVKDETPVEVKKFLGIPLPKFFQRGEK